MMTIYDLRFTIYDLRVAIAAGLSLAAVPGGDIPSREKAPNFVIFLTDDLGYGDLACYGNPMNSTPNIDRFAGSGVRLTDCHSAGTVCSPSRAAILTGRNPYRSGFHYIAGGKTYLKGDEITLAELLKTKGYQTAFFGKWHLSNLADSTQPDPGDQGFDYWMATSVNPFEGPLNPLRFVRNGKNTGKMEGWYCDIIVKESLDWLSKIDKKMPYFLVVCTHEPHSPVAPPDSLVKPFRDPKLLPVIKEIKYGGVDREGKYIQENAAKYYGTITQLDNAFGRFINGLDQQGYRKNSLILFTSDNGPEHPVNLEESLGEWSDSARDNCYGTPGSFRGMKRYPYEGGHRVPGIVRWPAKIPAGKVSDQLFNGADVLPVFCDLAGIAPPRDRKIDGEAVFNAFLDKKTDRKKPVLWIFPTHEDTYFRMPHMALRDSSFTLLGWFLPKQKEEKLLAWMKKSVPVRFELYDIKKDPAQSTDLFTTFPDISKRLSEEMISQWIDIRTEYNTVTRNP